MTFQTIFNFHKNINKDKMKTIHHTKFSELNKTNKFFPINFKNKFTFNFQAKLKNIKQKWHIEQDLKVQAKLVHFQY